VQPLGARAITALAGTNLVSKRKVNGRGVQTSCDTLLHSLRKLLSHHASRVQSPGHAPRWAQRHRGRPPELRATDADACCCRARACAHATVSAWPRNAAAHAFARRHACWHRDGARGAARRGRARAAADEWARPPRGAGFLPDARASDGARKASAPPSAASATAANPVASVTRRTARQTSRGASPRTGWKDS
jgi:hypothetical protein